MSSAASPSVTLIPPTARSKSARMISIPKTSNLIGWTVLYTGRELDMETGLQYSRARYYGADLGRFIGRDPIGFEGKDENLYRYCGNNTINSTDPSGLGFGEYCGAIHCPGPLPPPSPSVYKCGCGPYTGGAGLLGGYMKPGDCVTGAQCGNFTVLSGNLENGGNPDFDAAKCALKKLGFDLPQTENGIYIAKIPRGTMGYTCLWNGLAMDDLNYSFINGNLINGASLKDDANFLNLMVTIWHEVLGHNIDEEDDDKNPEKGPFHDKYEQPIIDAYNRAKKDGTWDKIIQECKIGKYATPNPSPKKPTPK